MLMKTLETVFQKLGFFLKEANMKHFHKIIISRKINHVAIVIYVNPHFPQQLSKQFSGWTVITDFAPESTLISDKKPGCKHCKIQNNMFLVPLDKTQFLALMALWIVNTTQSQELAITVTDLGFHSVGLNSRNIQGGHAFLQGFHFGLLKGW